jgi:hypothetical protein
MRWSSAPDRNQARQVGGPIAVRVALDGYGLGHRLKSRSPVAGGNSFTVADLLVTATLVKARLRIELESGRRQPEAFER